MTFLVEADSRCDCALVFAHWCKVSYGHTANQKSQKKYTFEKRTVCGAFGAAPLKKKIKNN